jgi:dCTP deaminase
MCIIGRSVFENLNAELCIITPYSRDMMDGDGYVLTTKNNITINYLEHINLISKEIVFVPPNYVAHLTAKSKFGRMGISFLNAAKVHSGFVGRLALEVVNMSNKRTPVKLSKDDPFMHFELMSREGDPSPYEGSYMFQFMDDSEVDKYMKILSEKFPKQYQLSTLRRTAKNRIMDIEEI